MRRRYLDERRKGSGPMLELARSLGETAWRGKIALLAGDLEGFGGQIDRNQELIGEMMRLCGFEAGAGSEVATLVRAAREAGALGAKLAGAGGGGAIFALALPGQHDHLADALRHTAAKAALSRSEVHIVRVSRAGLLIERDA
jgi:mevalonate kinase